MRSEQQPWNRINVTCEIVDFDGSGATGKTVHGLLKRISDGKWLQSGGGWGASPSTLTLAAVDATNLPGLYAYAVDPADLDYDAGLDGYFLKVTESTFVLLEYALISVLTQRDDIRDLDVSTLGSLTAGTLGDSIWRMLHLRQQNVRVVYDTFDGQTPTHGNVYVYNTKAEKEADVDPWAGAAAVYEFTATVSAGRVTEYGSTRES
jgi:hypothetical protein